MKQTRLLGVPLSRGRRFYVVRQKQESSTTVWVSGVSVAHAFDTASEPQEAEWASVYAHSSSGALSRAMGRKVKWRPYNGAAL